MVATAAPREGLPRVLLIWIDDDAVVVVPVGVVAVGFDQGWRRERAVEVEIAIEIIRNSRVRVPGEGGGAAREKVVGDMALGLGLGFFFERAMWEGCIRELLLLGLGLGCRRGVVLGCAVVGKRRRRIWGRRREIVMVVVGLRCEGGVSITVFLGMVVVVVEEVVLIHFGLELNGRNEEI